MSSFILSKWMTRKYRPACHIIQTTFRMMSSSAGKTIQRNRLAEEKSPYLLQHASNPVDWFPWGDEAIQKARMENKPIFLSVGYSTCHWCHVMERESFEDDEIGEFLNQNFVSIKVDREERPDVDKVYMTFVQATSGRGGWPMSVWMTPELKPFYGGTYFPPDNRNIGRPGFKSLLENIAEKWETDGSKLVEQSAGVLNALVKGTAPGPPGELPGQEVATRCFLSLEKSFDEEMGGFSTAPKFPQPVNLGFLLRVHSCHPVAPMGEQALEMALFTLRKMVKGGMHDHVGQGFHRYSTDTAWHVPHFEKMLYDQAQLAVSYSQAFQITKDPFFADITRDILQYVSRDLSHPSGGFYSAEDADSRVNHGDSEKKEGAFNVWTQHEITAILTESVEGKDDLTWTDIFSKHFDIREHGNVAQHQDPHGDLKNKNVLIERGSVEETSDYFKISVDLTRTIVSESLKLLFVEREKRPRPHQDNKMVAAWNGLMLSGFACAGQVLGDPKYSERAVQAANFLHKNMFLSGTGRLLRTCYTGSHSEISQIMNPIEGFVDDYAFVIRGLLDLYEVCFDERWIEWAAQLQEQQDHLFWDTDGGGYFSSQSEDKNIVLRIKDDQDGAEPSSNSVSASNLIRLSNLLERGDWREKAAQIFKLFSTRISKMPMAVPELISAFMHFNQSPKQIIIVGDKSSADTLDLLRCVNSAFLPYKTLVLWDGNKTSYLGEHLHILSSLQSIGGKATAYVCENYTCSLPVTSKEELGNLLH